MSIKGKNCYNIIKTQKRKNAYCYESLWSQKIYNFFNEYKANAQQLPFHVSVF